MAATLGRGRRRARRGLRRDGHGRAGLRGGRRAGASTRRGLVELHPHADPETWLLENPGWLSGGAYRWFRDELGREELDRARRGAASTSTSCSTSSPRRRRPAPTASIWLPALAGAMAPEWNADARAGWFGADAGAQPRPPAPGAARGQRATRSATSSTRCAAPAIEPREIVCVGGGAAGRLLVPDPRRRHRPAGRAARPTSRRRPAAPRCSPPPAPGCTRRWPTRRARWPGRAREPALPDPELRARLRRRCTRRHRAALRRAAAAVRRAGHWATRGLTSTAGPRSDAAASGDLDLLVVGGGITGAGAALDAATRGLSVALVEARDLAAGTSSASSKLFHGGLRYLEMGDFGLVREALRERELMLTRLAPHLVRPVPFLWPLRGRGLGARVPGRGPAALRHDRRRPLGAPPPPPPARALPEAPALRADALVGGVQFHDARGRRRAMVVAVARTAAAHGAHVATRVRVTGACATARSVASTRVDEETGEPLTLRARHVACAAGPWTDARARARRRAPRRTASCRPRASTSSSPASASRWTPACSPAPRRACCSSSPGRAAG